MPEKTPRGIRQRPPGASDADAPTAFQKKTAGFQMPLESGVDSRQGAGWKRLASYFPPAVKDILTAIPKKIFHWCPAKDSQAPLGFVLPL
jgi:hypothetical protein